MENILPTALGDFGLTYDYFMDLTPKQWAYYVKGRQQREERQMQMLAWVTAHVMNASGNMKQPITVDMLLGRQKSVGVKPTHVDFKELNKWVSR